MPHRLQLDIHTGHVRYPLLFLYPSSRQTDLVADVDELDTVFEHIVPVLADPPPWDAQHAFTVAHVDLYVELRSSPETSASALKKLDKSTRLAEVASWDGVWLEQGTLGILVVSRQEPEFWKTFSGQYDRIE